MGQVTAWTDEGSGIVLKVSWTSIAIGTPAEDRFEAPDTAAVIFGHPLGEPLTADECECVAGVLLKLAAKKRAGNK